MTYTTMAIIAVLAAVIGDLTIGARLLQRPAFWLSYLIIVCFQLLVNGVLTGLDVVRYDDDAISGLRLAYAPIEDLGFGFAMTVLTLNTWVLLRRR